MHPRHQELGVAGERRRRAGLVVGLPQIVDLLGDPGGHLARDGDHVDPAGQRRDHRGQPFDLTQVRAQCPVGARVLDLDRDRFAAGQHAAVHLPDGRRRGRSQVEPGEPVAPAGTQFAAQHRLHPGRRQRGSAVLQLRQVLPVGPGQLLGQERLEQAEHLAELHRPALELTQDAEQLLRGGLPQVGVHHPGIGTQHPAAQADRLPLRRPQRQGEHPGGPGQRGGRQRPVLLGRIRAAHPAIVPSRPGPSGNSTMAPHRSAAPSAT